MEKKRVARSCTLEAVLDSIPMIFENNFREFVGRSMVVLRRIWFLVRRGIQTLDASKRDNGRFPSRDKQTQSPRPSPVIHPSPPFPLFGVV
jgi:hypothetical protein